MKIFIINPDWGMDRAQMDRECEFLSAFVREDTILHMECLTKTRVCLDSSADIVMAGPEILEMTVDAQKSGYDAVILYCFSDPVLEACRQMVEIPVIGAGQAACMMLPVVGYQGAILVADGRRIPEKKASFYRTGLADGRICGYEAVELIQNTDQNADTNIAASANRNTDKDADCLKRALLVAGERALKNTQAQVLILGCLSFLGFSKELEEKLHVPVIDPGPASVTLAEAVVSQGLSTSKKAYLSDIDLVTH
ncbi:MAG: aspartate/glutamate racemase family protein [Clostridiales bacterium]|nr:aspartate/glutamate racemase family protein [Clostridiales bacterium]